MVAQVLQANQATLRELRECYSMQDLYNMWEVTYTAKYNKWLSAERARQESELNAIGG